MAIKFRARIFMLSLFFVFVFMQVVHADLMTTLDSALYPFQNFQIDQLYLRYAGLIDIILYIIFFGGLTKKLLTDRLGNKAATIIGIMLGLSLGVWGAMNRFNLISLGPAVALLFTLIFGYLMYHFIMAFYSNPNEHHPSAAAFAYLVTFSVMMSVVPQVPEFLRGAPFGDLVMSILWIFAIFCVFRVFISLWGLLFPPRPEAPAAVGGGGAPVAPPVAGGPRFPDMWHRIQDAWDRSRGRAARNTPPADLTVVRQRITNFNNTLPYFEQAMNRMHTLRTTLETYPPAAMRATPAVIVPFRGQVITLFNTIATPRMNAAYTAMGEVQRSRDLANLPRAERDAFNHNVNLFTTYVAQFTADHGYCVVNMY